MQTTRPCSAIHQGSFIACTGAALAFASPLLAPYLINPQPLPFYIVPACFSLFLAAVFFRRKNILLPIPYILLLSGFLLSQSILYVDGYINHFENWMAGLMLLSVSAITFLTAGSHRPSKKTVAVFITSALIWSGLGMFVWLGGNDGDALHFGFWALTTDAQVKISGPFTNGNVFGIISACAWVIAVWQWLQVKNRGWLWWSLACFFWYMAVLSMSRGTWVAQSLIILPLIFRIWKYQRPSLLPFVLAGVLAWGAASITISEIYPSGHVNITERFETSATYGFSGRIVLWASAWEIWKEHPLLGVGIGNFGAHYLDGQSQALQWLDSKHHGLRNTTSAHNTLLHLMAESGVIGIVVWITITTLLIRLCWLYRHHMHSIRWAALSCAVLLWIQGLFNISMTEPFPVLLFSIMLGWSAAPLLRRGKQLKAPGKALSLLMIGCFVVLSTAAFGTARAWIDFETWRALEQHHPAKGALAAKLIQRNGIMPYVIEASARDFITDPARIDTVGKMRPFIEQALAIQQRPLLLQELFFAQMVNSELEQACRTGRFIQSQKWGETGNSALYQQACNGENFLRAGP
ncbi:MAG: O-antigen ligase family protein [Mariprofundaceae bacterium]|nr:O-antigen ligase family protein [Mariprofundaceae bacterium]